MDASPTGLLLSSATGLVLGAYYTLNKKVSGAGNPLQIIFWIFASHLPPIALWLALHGGSSVDPWYFLPGLCVLILTVGGNFFTVRALSFSPLNLMMPVMCLSPVLTVLIAIPLLGELPSFHQSVGIALAVVGVLWLYAPPERPWDLLAFWKNFLQERGALPMLFSALCWSLSAPMDKLALRHADPAFHALFVFSGLSIFVYFWIRARGEWDSTSIPRRFWFLLLATGAAGAITDILQLFALLHTPVGMFEAMKRVLSQVFALGLAAWLFHERLTRPRLIGITIITISVPLVVL